MLGRRHARRATALFLRGFLLLFVVSLVLVAGRSFLPSSLVDKELSAAKSVLWIIAHPDDESFFFAPTILGLLSNPAQPAGGLLCLSIGNHDGLGAVRRAELEASCAVLGIPEDRCAVVDSPALPDSPDAWWTRDSIAPHVRQLVREWDVEAVVSFDRYGVSGHANHRAIAAALESIAATTPSFPPIFAIASTTVLAKYTSTALLPLSVLQHVLGVAFGRRPARSLFINSPLQYIQTRRSFAVHRSQSRWFRTLFVLFSRYLWFVSVDRLGP
ncbi:hypothetical protein JCM10207_004513 [Rhodosporidiobolus poonsookiae]